MRRVLHAHAESAMNVINWNTAAMIRRRPTRRPPGTFSRLGQHDRQHVAQRPFARRNGIRRPRPRIEPHHPVV